MANKTEILLPVGRLVMGNPFEAQTTDGDGRPLTIKRGPNVGQPRVEYFIGVAVPKAGEMHWNQTEWGAKIYNEARVSFPTLFDANGHCINPAFAYKIIDGDSDIPNTKGVRPNTREGFPGHWVVQMSGGFAIKCFARENGEHVTLVDPSSIKRGDYIEAYGNVAGNGEQTKPGVFINPTMVMRTWFGTEIVSGPSVGDVFSKVAGALPQGASATPLASATPMQQPQQQQAYQAPAAPVQQQAYQAPAAPVQQQAYQAPAAPVQQQAAVTPAPDFLNAPVVKTYVVQGNTWTEQQLRDVGYTDAHLAALGQ